MTASILPSRALVAGATLAVAVFAVTAARVAVAAEAAPAPADKVTRGKYLVATSGCHDCHTPFKPGPNGPEPDWSRMLSGHPEDLVMPPVPALPPGPWQIVSAGTNTAWSGPWGVSFTANLTPDRQTGLGKWSFTNFKDTIRTGRHQGRGRPVLPPMPIPVYNNFTDEDLEAIYSYLRTIPPIRNRVPLPLPPPALPAPVASN